MLKFEPGSSYMLNKHYSSKLHHHTRLFFDYSFFIIIICVYMMSMCEYAILLRIGISPSTVSSRDYTQAVRFAWKAVLPVEPFCWPQKDPPSLFFYP